MPPSASPPPSSHRRRPLTREKLYSVGEERQERSVEVDGVPELQTEPDPVLIHIDLRRRSSRALSQERVSPKEGYVLSNLIGRAEAQCECLDVDLRGAEHNKQASLQGQKRERA